MTPPHAAWYPAWSHLLPDLVTAVVVLPTNCRAETGEVVRRRASGEKFCETAYPRHRAEIRDAQ